MMRVLVVLLLLLTGVAGRGMGQSRWAVSASAAPVLTFTDYNRRYLYPDSDGQVVEPIYLDGQRWTSGYSVGLTGQYSWAPGWSVGAGVWYRQDAIRLTRLVAAGEGSTAVRSRVVRVPLLLNYRSATRPLSPLFTFGTLLDFPMPSQVTAVRVGEPTQQLRLASDGGPVFYVLLGAGGQYRFNDRYALSVQPTWAYNLGRFGGAATYNSSFDLSLLTQLTYQF